MTPTLWTQTSQRLTTIVSNCLQRIGLSNIDKARPIAAAATSSQSGIESCSEPSAQQSTPEQKPIKQLQPTPSPNLTDKQANTKIMDSADERSALIAEREKLEQEIVTMTNKLEALKNNSDIKVEQNQIIRSEEDKALEAASLAKAVNQGKKPTNDVDKLNKTKKDKKEAAQSQATEGAKKTGSGRAKEAPAPERPSDISRLDLRVGKIVEVDRHPDADALYVEKIDLGEESGPRTVISGLVKHVPIEEMKDKMVLVLCNLKPVKMRGIMSHAMVMCASSEEKVELLSPPSEAKIGDRVCLDGYPGDPDEQLNPKKKIWEQVAPDLKTNDEGIAVYKGQPLRIPSYQSDFKSNLKNVQVR